MPTRTARLVAASTGTTFVVLLVLVAAEWSPLRDLDHDLVGPSVDLARDHDGYRAVMKTVTFLLHSQVLLFYAALIAAALVRKRRPGAAIWVVAVMGIGTWLSPLLKQAVGRHRPAVADPVESFRGLSFPSGHATSAALLCSVLAVVFLPALAGRPRTALAIALVAVPLVSCWTRMTLGAHYLSDVIGGLLLGVAWVALWAPALPGFERALSERRAWRR